MIKLVRFLVATCLVIFTGCAQRKPDFTRTVASPSGEMVAGIAGYQPRGTIAGYLTVSFAPSGGEVKPQIMFGHMLKVQAGWLDDHTFAIIYAVLEPRRLASPVYPTGLAESAVEVVLCNARYLDCSPVLRRILPAHSLKIDQFPEGSWPAGN